MKIKMAITILCLITLLGHNIWPSIKLDITTLILIALAILPWASSIIKTIEFPGGFKIELQDVKAATEKVTAGKTIIKKSLSSPAETGAGIEFFNNIAQSNPNLALVSLRIEIERRLLELAKLHNLLTGKQSAGYLLRNLASHGYIDQQTAAGLNELIALGNQAAHGVEVSPTAASWAIDIAPMILEILDSLLSDRDTLNNK